jgi:hypothetical protein
MSVEGERAPTTSLFRLGRLRALLFDLEDDAPVTRLPM